MDVLIKVFFDQEKEMEKILDQAEEALWKLDKELAVKVWRVNLSIKALRKASEEMWHAQERKSKTSSKE